MCGGGGQSAPTPPPRLPEAAQTPVVPSQGTTPAKKDKSRRARAAGAAPGSSILTGPRGVTEEGVTAQKTLLGA